LTLAYRLNRVVIVSYLRTYFGVIVLKTRIYANTLAGNQKSAAANSSVMPPKPRAAGIATDSTKPRVNQGMRCHQIGPIGSLQNGQVRYGRLDSRPLGLRSARQLGQAPHVLLYLRLANFFIITYCMLLQTSCIVSRTLP